jgi:serine/threonine protein kinase
MFNAAKIPDLYSDVEQIGKGASAIVFRATERCSGHSVALKKFKTMMLPELGHRRGSLADNEEALADILTEVRIMQRCNHDNVLRLRDSVVETSSVGYVGPPPLPRK